MFLWHAYYARHKYGNWSLTLSSRSLDNSTITYNSKLRSFFNKQLYYSGVIRLFTCAKSSCILVLFSPHFSDIIHLPCNGGMPNKMFTKVIPSMILQKLYLG